MKIALRGILIFLVIASCCGQDKKKILVNAFSSYNSTALPTSFYPSGARTDYDSLIQYSLELLGLPDTDLEVATTSTFGAFSVINRQSFRRFFIYSPVFFDSVVKVTGTRLGVLSICFHELAHQFYRHPLKPSYASHLYEKQADRYSGFEMAVIGATMEESVLAMKHFGNDTETQTHPDKASRLAEIEKGYIDARSKIFKDTSYIKRDSVFKIHEFMSAVYNELAFSQIQSMEYSDDKIQTQAAKTLRKVTTKEVYSFYGDLIQVTADNKIQLISNNQIIGSLLQLNHNSKMLSIGGVKFYLEEDKIYSSNPDGFKLEVGNKVINKFKLK